MDFVHSAEDSVSSWYGDFKDKMAHWGEDVQEQFGKMVEEGRDLRVSTVSKMIKHGISNMDAF